MVTEPTVAATDDADNEFGRCKVCPANCFRGSTQDLCQVCLRCNVDYQYQNRTFPEEEAKGQDVGDGASEHEGPDHDDARLQEALHLYDKELSKYSGSSGAEKHAEMPSKEQRSGSCSS